MGFFSNICLFCESSRKWYNGKYELLGTIKAFETAQKLLKLLPALAIETYFQKYQAYILSQNKQSFITHVEIYITRKVLE
jgi:hypothetical protein